MHGVGYSAFYLSLGGAVAVVVSWRFQARSREGSKHQISKNRRYLRWVCGSTTAAVLWIYGKAEALRYATSGPRHSGPSVSLHQRACCMLVCVLFFYATQFHTPSRLYVGRVAYACNTRPLAPILNDRFCEGWSRTFLVQLQ